MVGPPLGAGAVKVTVALALPRVAVPIVGAPGAAVEKDVPVTVELPPVYPVRAVVIVAVDDVPAATPVTVTSPVLLIATEPLAVAVPAHV